MFVFGVYNIFFPFALLSSAMLCCAASPVTLIFSHSSTSYCRVYRCVHIRIATFIQWIHFFFLNLDSFFLFHSLYFIFGECQCLLTSTLSGRDNRTQLCREFAMFLGYVRDVFISKSYFRRCNVRFNWFKWFSHENFELKSIYFHVIVSQCQRRCREECILWFQRRENYFSNSLK